MINYFSSENIERITEGLKNRGLTNKNIINIETVDSKQKSKSYFRIWYTKTNK